MKETTAFDKDLGMRIRERRRMSGKSLADVAGHLGVAYQQLYKYETGLNRISAYRLKQLSEALGVPITYWFGDVSPHVPTPGENAVLDLVKHFRALDADHRTLAASLMKRWAELTTGGNHG